MRIAEFGMRNCSVLAETLHHNVSHAMLMLATLMPETFSLETKDVAMQRLYVFQRKKTKGLAFLEDTILAAPD